MMLSKKEIDKLNKKKATLDPDNNSKECTTELVKKLDYMGGGADNFLDQKEQGEEKHGIYGTRKRTSSRPI